MMASKMLRVVAGHYHLFHRVAPTVANFKGYFAEEGLEVAVSATGTDVKSVQALTRGEAHIIVDLKAPVALRARDQGEDILFIGGFLNTYPGILVGAKHIRSIADLRGGKVGVREPNGVQLTLSSMVLTKAGMNPDLDVTIIPHTGASSFKSIAPRLDRGEMQGKIAHKAYADDFRQAGYPILADLEEYLPNGYTLRGMATTSSVLEQSREAVVGFLKGMIRAYRFMKDPSKHAEMMAIIQSSDLQFEEDMDQGMWEEEYPLISAIPPDGSVNVRGVDIILDEEKASGKISPELTVDVVVELGPVKQALVEIVRSEDANCS
jgi:ABC-type nitrate/sulfonate/bicarbonate transport system substrate-binding protein